MKLNEYISEAKAAKLLGIQAPTLKKWAKMGKIKHYIDPLSGRRLYVEYEIRAILEGIK